MSWSNAKSEYKAMIQSTCNILWIHLFLVEVGLNPLSPTKLWCDNQAALHITSNLMYYERTKHIDIDCHFIHEKIQENLISTNYVKTWEQLSDIFTKALNETQTKYFVTSWVWLIFMLELDECYKITLFFLVIVGS